MILGLSDILAVQQVDKPQVSGDARSLISASADKPKFMDFLKDNNDVKRTPVRDDSNSPDREVINSNNSSAVTSSVESDSSTTRDTYTENPTTDVEGSIEVADRQNIPCEAKNNNCDGRVNVSEDEVLNEVVEPSGLTLQQPEVFAETNLASKVPEINILNPEQEIQLSELEGALQIFTESNPDTKSGTIGAIEAILPKLVAHGVPEGVEAEDVIQQIAQQLENISSSSAYVVEDILDKMDFSVDQETGQVIVQTAAGNLKQTNPADVAKVAEKVIEYAKESAEKPNIPASDIRLLQVEELVNLGKKDGKDNKNKDGFQTIGLDTQDSALQEDISTNVNQQLRTILSMENKKLDDGLSRDRTELLNNFAGNIAGNSINQQQGNITNNAFSDVVKNVIGQQEAADEDSAIKLNSTSPASMFSENFVKFQKIMEEAQILAKNTTTSRNQSADEVVAQIKFGLSNSAGRGERNISIQLHPKELGKVDIRMEMGDDGKTNVMVIAEKTDTLNLLQKEASSLKSMLTDALKTDSGNLNFSFHERNSDEWRQFANDTINKRTMDSGDISSAYMPARGYQYNMIATDGLDIRV